jgi:hypothetical protein
LARSDGGTFDLHSIDLAEVPNFSGTTGGPVDLGSFQLTFFGTRSDHSTVQATATIDPFPTVNTFHFSNFTDLLSVTWYQGPGGVPGPTHQFDNIRIQPVPEPPALLLVGVGISILVCWRHFARLVHNRAALVRQEAA